MNTPIKVLTPTGAIGTGFPRAAFDQTLLKPRAARRVLSFRPPCRTGTGTGLNGRSCCWTRLEPLRRTGHELR
ncbi:hypothetical protein SAMN03159290_04012 [Pseudomonas sp. NFACC13-1]|nr:hypothetical protein SAMN03159290_04012 [Pseudomonas sp. NFACC13-1]